MCFAYHRTASARRRPPALVSIGGVSGFCDGTGGGDGRGALVKNRTTTTTTTTKTTTTTPPPLSGHPVLRCGEQTGKKSLSLSLSRSPPLPSATTHLFRPRPSSCTPPPLRRASAARGGESDGGGGFVRVMGGYEKTI